MEDSLVEQDQNSQIEVIQSEVEDDFEDTSNYEIISYGADFTISVYYDKMKKEEIITPTFQRRFVWNIYQSSRLIESFLLGLPVPGIFLAKEPKTGDLLVIDGQQRLITCKSFRDEIFPKDGKPFVLQGVKRKWRQKKYSELNATDRKRFDDSVLRATIIQQIRPEDQTSIYHIFQRLNTGGVPLSNQEIRNALFQGNFTDLLCELNNDPIWRKLYHSPHPNPRRKDEELILRFFALFYNYSEYRRPMNEFLSIFMEKNRVLDDLKHQEMKSLFQNTISIINNQAGYEAFRPKGNINAAVFDSIMYTVAKYEKKLKSPIKDQISLLFKNSDYLNAINTGTTDEENVKRRLEISKKILVEE